MLMTHLKTESMAKTTIAMTREADNTTIALWVNSLVVGQVVLCASSS